MTQPLLTVTDLTVDYTRGRQVHTAVKHVGFEIEKGKALALVGESGCGKSTIALALMGLLPKHESVIRSGRILFDENDLTQFSDQAWRQIRGKRIGIVFQDPFSSLNPVLTIGDQLEEALNLDNVANPKEKSFGLLKRVQLMDVERIHRSFPHQLSGGQRQRALIAIALSREPALLIADEPTTALDVTVQDEIIKLLKSLQISSNMSLLFITHNLGLVKNLADNVAVMRAGDIVETGPVQHVLAKPTHPYTNGLLHCMPTLKKSQGPLPTLENLA